MTPYHSQYFAFEITRRFSADSMEKLVATVAGAHVDLNPHQVDAALFAFHSPLSKGALMADEVDARRETLIVEVENRLTQNSPLEELFTIRWRLI